MGINLGNFGGGNNPQPQILNLQKNQILDLTKRNPGLKKVTLGAGWDISNGGLDFDIDIAAFLLDANNKFNTVSNVIFFNNKQGQGIALSGDNRTGAGEGDDETILMDLETLIKYKIAVQKLKKDGYQVSIALTSDSNIDSKYYSCMELIESIYVDKNIPNIIQKLSVLPEDLADKLVYENVIENLGDFGGEE